jgi:hypothetical protein
MSVTPSDRLRIHPSGKGFAAMSPRWYRHTMRRCGLVLFLLLVSVCCSSSATRTAAPSAAQSEFTFQSNLWVNLHHFLRAVARGEPAPAKLTSEERSVWDQAVAVYAAKYMNRDVLRDDGMVAIKEALRNVHGDGPLPDIPGEPDLKPLLESVAPIYRKHWWPAHDTQNRSWIAAAQPLLERYGRELSHDVAVSYGVEWPSNPIPVDLSVTAGPVGAYTTYPPHSTLASTNRGFLGLAGLEMLFHEASHQWGRALQTGIEKAATARKIEVPPQLWHAVLFYNAGELTRRVLLEDGVGGYTEYAVQQDLYKSLCGDGCRERVVKYWGPHLDGSASIEVALDNLVADWPQAN